MAGLPIVTMEGRLVRDPELRYTPNGAAVCSFTIVAQDRKQNPQTSEWEDVGDPLFVRVSAWRVLGENTAESLTKGDLAVVTGKLSMRKFQDSNTGVERQSLEINAFQVGAALQFRSMVHSGKRDPGGVSQRTAGRSDDPWGGPVPAADDAPPF